MTMIFVYHFLKQCFGGLKIATFLKRNCDPVPASYQGKAFILKLGVCK